MFELLLDPNAWLAFLTLTALELVLGIDNIIFISILVERLPKAQQRAARRLGLAMAMVMRLGLLLLLSWIFGLTQPLFAALGQQISGRDLILVAGGLFLLWKSTKEIHHLLEGGGEDGSSVGKETFTSVILQIMVIDIVFSLDSIITAVGMVDEVQVMMAAVVASVGLMMLFAEGIARIVAAHPTIKVLALAFLIVVGVVLVADGFETHIPKGYVYFAMAFSVAVEAINLRMRRKTEPVHLHQRYESPVQASTASVVLMVKDLARTAAFYREVLGQQPVSEDEDQITFGYSNLELILQRLPAPLARNIEVSTPPQRREQSAHKLRFHVASIARAREAAARSGGMLDAAPPAWVVDQQKICAGHDPEGNLLELHED
jgi:predicted tellurium resistance membrane protein TerC/catechol 2,3-dioxygenase-like lactoylglutathione lyase family enzyme